MAEDDRWSDVIEQVLSALHDADVKDGPTREALAAGVREALESLEGGIDLDVQILGSDQIDISVTDDSGVNIEVVPGGRDSGDPKTDGARPELRIAEEDDSEDTPPHRASDSAPVLTHVKVLRSTSSIVDSDEPGIPGLADTGWIHVAPGGAAEAAWQTVYRGSRPRVYRVACARGSLDVTVDGEPVERLLAGQSIDVEGSAIRVTSQEEGGARGGYAPVPARDEGEE